MAKLVVSLGNTVQGHYFLNKEHFVIGRNEDCDIRLNDPGVSKSHALVITIENDQILEDTFSSNGVKVNGEKVTRCILQNNDVIEIGNYQLKYVNLRASANMDFDKTMILESTPWSIDDTADGDMQKSNQPKKVVTVAREVATNFPLGGVRGVKGENNGQEIVISRPFKTFGQIGGHLAMISRRPMGYYVAHVEGKTPTRLNGKPIGSNPYLLKENDAIEVANQKLIFFLKS